jgi:hypothetical protein
MAHGGDMVSNCALCWGHRDRGKDREAVIEVPRQRRRIALALLVVSIAPSLAFGDGIVNPDGEAAIPGGADARAEQSTARWTELGPPMRGDHAGVFDERRRRLVIFGSTIGGEWQWRNDVWMLNLDGAAGWKRLQPRGGSPSGRVGAAAIYDARRDRMLVIGGLGAGGALADVWELSLGGETRWTELHPSGSRPEGRCHHSATYDPEHDRVLVFGGSPTISTGTMDDLWQLQLGESPSWTRLRPNGPRPRVRASHAAVYAPDLRGVLMYGGAGLEESPFGLAPDDWEETWFLSTGDSISWTNLTPRLAGHPPTGSAEGAVASYDEVTGRMLLALGHANEIDCADLSRCRDGSVAWLSVRDSLWTQPSPAGAAPSNREHGVGFIDPATRRLIVEGGKQNWLGGALADTWSLSLDGPASWSPLLVPPRPGFNHAYGVGSQCVYDVPRNRLLCFTGGGLWSRDLSGAHPWMLEQPAGPSPPNRIRHLVLLDTARDRMIVYGGISPRFIPPFGTNLFDTWELSLRGPLTWKPLATSGDPPLLVDACAAYDPRRDRMIAMTAFGSQVGDTVWQLSLGDHPAWSALAQRGQGVWPWPAYGASMIYDARRDEVVRFGGAWRDGSTNSTWALSLSGPPQWKVINYDVARPTDAPRARAFQSAVDDAARDRMLVFGGYDPFSISGALEGVWSLDLASRSWSLLAADGEPAPVWSRPMVALDPRADVVTVLEPDYAWQLDLQPGRAPAHAPAPAATEQVQASATPPPRADLAIRGGRPDLAPEMTCEFALTSSAPATLEVFDISGRHVWSSAVGSLGAGWHEVSIPARARPGLYLLRLTQGDASVTAKLVRLR